MRASSHGTGTVAKARDEIGLVETSMAAVQRGGAFLAAKQTPVFFGSAVNNFGVQEVLDAVVDLAPPPLGRIAIQRPSLRRIDVSIAGPSRTFRS